MAISLEILINNFVRKRIMKHLIYSWILSLLILVVIDFVWLNLMGSRFYRVHLGYIFAENFNFTPAMFFYPLYCFGIAYLIITPALQSDVKTAQVLLSGFILGLIAYGAYDLTNQATIKDWPLIVTIVDMLWGAFVTSIASGLSYKILIRFS